MEDLVNFKVNHDSQDIILQNLWFDRRKVRLPFEGSDKRSGIDRRKKMVSIANDRRGKRETTHCLINSRRFERLLLVGGDSIGLILAFFGAALIILAIGDYQRFSSDFIVWWEKKGQIRVPLFLFLMGVTVISFWILGHYTQRRPFWDELLETIKIILIVGCLDATLTFFGKWEFSRMWLLSTWGLALVLIPYVRVTIKHVLINMGGWMKPTVIIGTGQNAVDTAKALLSETLMGFNVKAFMIPPTTWPTLEENLNQNKEYMELEGFRMPLYRLGEQPEKILTKLGKPHIVVALDCDECWEVTKLLHNSRLFYSSLIIAPPIRGLPVLSTRTLNFFRHEVLLLQVQNNLARKVPQRVKRNFDILVASFLLILLSPLFMYICWCIRRTGCKAFYSHSRIGQAGKTFKCHKFQTMVPNADEVLKRLLETDFSAKNEWEQNFKLKNDPRITRIGDFLRKTSLDELPQLWNVLKGDMSLVGPRPVIIKELEYYRDNVDYYLETKPGMTGLWQISGRNNTSYEDRVYLDAWYVRNWTLWCDIVILLKTFKEVLNRQGAY